MKQMVAATVPGLTISRLRALTAVADEGSYAAAARRLGLSHTAVAQQIRDLEQVFGQTIFVRTNGRLLPSPVGRELCEIGERILDAEREAARIVGRRDASGRVNLRVGLGNSMPGMAIIAAVCQAHPSLAVTLQSGSHSAILAAVQRREVDVGVLPDVPRDPRFRRQPLLRQEVVAISSVRSGLPEGTVMPLADLMHWPLIFRSSGSSTQRVVAAALARSGLAPMPRLVADTRDAVFEAVVAGVGIGFMWRHGTASTDLVRRLSVPELSKPVEETVFSLTDERNPTTDLFFLAAAQFGAPV